MTTRENDRQVLNLLVKQLMGRLPEDVEIRPVPPDIDTIRVEYLNPEMGVETLANYHFHSVIFQVMAAYDPINKVLYIQEFDV